MALNAENAFAYKGNNKDLCLLCLIVYSLQKSTVVNVQSDKKYEKCGLDLICSLSSDKIYIGDSNAQSFCALAKQAATS